MFTKEEIASANSTNRSDLIFQEYEPLDFEVLKVVEKDDAARIDVHIVFTTEAYKGRQKVLFFRKENNYDRQDLLRLLGQAFTPEQILDETTWKSNLPGCKFSCVASKIRKSDGGRVFQNLTKFVGIKDDIAY